MENPEDSSIMKLHRELILSTACSINNIHCLETSKTLFKSWILSEKRYGQLAARFCNQYGCTYLQY